MIIWLQQHIALIQVARPVDEAIDNHLTVSSFIKPCHLHLNRRLLQTAGRLDEHRDRHVAAGLKRIHAGARERSLELDEAHVGR